MLRLLRLVARNKKGATAIEYGLIAALIVMGMMTALSALANVSIDMWNNISTKVQNNT